MGDEDTLGCTVDETARRRFESAWHQGRPEEIEACLPPAGHPNYLSTLEELVHIELEFGWRSHSRTVGAAGHRVPASRFVEHYLHRFPALDEPATILRLLRQEYRVRHRYGDCPPPGEYHDRFPEFVATGREVEDALRNGDRSSTPPPQVPGYEILSVLGRGGMGVVYKARHRELDRLVALKMLLAGAHAGPEELARFRAEATAAARLKDPHIVQVHEIGEQDGCPFISQELIDGGSLKERIAGTPQSGRWSARMVETLARTVHRAHEQGIIHRDLKPPNILLTADGVPKISDFGLAKRVGSDLEQTATGAVVGTPSYMAPEQARGETKQIGPATDVYALGVILYELLTGRPPFRAVTSWDTVSQVVSDEPVPPSRLRPKMSRDLETICLKCLQKSPAHRYAGGDALAEDLRRFLDGEPILARPVGAIERGVKWAKRRPAVAALAALVVLVTLVGFGGVLWQWRKAEGSREDAEARARAERRAKDDAREAQRATAAALQEAERNLYFHRVALADRRWWAANVAAADRLLDACPKAMRGWEWRFLKWRCHSERMTLGEVPYTYGGRTFRRAQFSFRGLTFSRDGKLLASGDGAMNVWIWDAATGRRLHPRIRRGGPFRSVAFSPDGTRLAVAGEDRTVKILNVRTGKEVRSIPGHVGRVYSVAFSPDGKRLASVSGKRNEFGEIKVRRPTDGRELLAWRGHRSNVGGVVFSPDGEHLATAGWDGDVKIWDAATGREVRSLGGHGDGASVLAYSPGGGLLAAAAADRTVRLWDPGTGRLVRSLAGHSGFVRGVAFSPGGERLATCGNDRTVMLWDVDGGRKITTFRGHAGEVLGVTFSPDGTRLASGGAYSVKIWDAATRQEGSVLPQEAKGPAFSPDSRYLVAARGTEAEIWDVAARRVVRVLRGHTRKVTCVAFSPRGKPRIVTGGADGAVKLWDAATGAEIPVSLRHENRDVLAVAFSPDGRRIASATKMPREPLGPGRKLPPGEVKVWDVKTGREVLALCGESMVNMVGVAFRPDGRQIAAACDYLQEAGGLMRGAVALWDAETGRELLTLRGHSGVITALAYSPDGSLLASASRDETVKLWGTRTGRDLLTLGGHADYVHGVAFSPDGRRLASASKAVRLWDVETGREVLSLTLGRAGVFKSVTFSPDGKMLVAGGRAGTVLWRAPASEPPAPPPR